MKVWGIKKELILLGAFRILKTLKLKNFGLSKCVKVPASSYLKVFDVLKILRELWPYLWDTSYRLKYRFVLSVICTSLGIARFVGTPVLFAYIVDTYNFSAGNMNILWFLFLLVGYVLLWSLGKLFLCLRELLMVPVTERAVSSLSFKLYQHVQFLPFHYHSKRKVGEIVSTIEASIAAFPLIVWAIFFTLGPLLLESMCVIGIVGCICGGGYALILSIVFLLFVITTHLGFRKIIPSSQEANAAHVRAVGKIVDSLLSFASTKYFHAYNYEFEKINNQLAYREAKIVASLVKEYIVPISQNFILSASFLFLILFTGYNLVLGKISLGNFIMIHTYMLQFTLPLERLGQAFQALNQNLIKMERVFKIFKEPLEDRKGKITLGKEELPHIVFDDVWFGYQENMPILKGVSFELLPRKSLAIIGETGSGKSTILRLLLGFLEPWKGRIMINGHDLKKVDQKSFIDLIGIVPQEVTLFHDSILDNILYANPLANTKMLQDAIQLANLEKTIKKLPEGLQTIVGEMGGQLSGGERQRVGLARAVIRQPKAYIFDEATSSLDPKTENKILKNMQKVSHGVSTLIVSHKQSAISFADQIMELNQGILKMVVV